MSTIPSGYKKLSVIGISYKGDYNVANTYSKLNAVYYDGSTYIALIDNPVGAPTNDNVNWKYMAQGFLSSQLSSLSAVDIEGLLGVVGASVNAQTLVNKLAELIDSKENKITKNTAFNKNFETDSSVLKANGTASVGTSTNVARADHVHPSDSTKLSANGNASNTTVAFTSSDKLTDLEYIDVEVVATGETQSSLMAKLSQISQNVRYIKENGTSQGSTIVVTFKDDELIGKTCKITSSTFEYTQTVNSEKKAVFEVAELGTLTATCECLTKELIIYNKGNYTIAFDSFVEMLVSKSGVTNTYTSVANLLENQLDTRRVMTVHASADFLVSLMTTFTSVRDTVIDSTYGLKWIGLRDYICDKLMAVSSIKTAMLESDNWEYILKDHVPVMTSDSAPYGTAYSNSTASGFYSYSAFDGNDETVWYPTTTKTNAYVGYKFVNPIRVNSIKITEQGTISDGNSGDNTRIKNFKVQASNDNSTWVDIYSNTFAKVLSDGSNKSQSFSFENDNYYLYYRLYILDCYITTSGSGILVGGLQFYGRSLNVSVPTMTSNTEPYGEASASSIYGSSTDAYITFSKSEDNAMCWATQLGIVTNSYVGYKFNNPINLKMVYWRTRKHTVSANVNPPKNYKIQASNDNSTWVDLTNVITNAKVGSAQETFININSTEKYMYYRMFINDSIDTGDSAKYIAVGQLNLYGVDYSEREYAPNSTMKYIYDHGVELEELDLITTSYGTAYTSTVNVTSNDDSIYLPLPSGNLGCGNFSNKNKISVSNYDYAFVNTDINIPQNCLIDISSVSDDVYIECGIFTWSGEYGQIIEISTNKVNSSGRMSFVNICPRNTYKNGYNVYELWLE